MADGVSKPLLASNEALYEYAARLSEAERQAIGLTATTVTTASTQLHLE